MSVHSQRAKIRSVISAIHAGDIGRLRRLVNIAADYQILNAFDPNGLLPLVVAANRYDLEMCRVLVELGSNMDGFDYSTDEETTSSMTNRCSPLCNAVSYGLTAAVKTLIKLGCDVNDPSCSGAVHNLSFNRNDAYRIRFNRNYTPLILALLKDNFETVKLLLEAGGDINQSDAFGNTSLHFACDCTSFGMKEIITLFRTRPKFKIKSDLNAQNKDGETPLMSAICKKNHDAVLALLKEDVINVNLENGIGFTALHCAVQFGTEEILLALLSAGCKIYSSHWKTSPLFLAVSNNNLPFCELLVDFGANPFERCTEDDSLLCAAINHKSLDLVKFVLSAGFSVNDKDYYHYPAIIVAAKNNYISILHYLIQRGALLNKKSPFSETALQKSLQYCKVESSICLILEGATRLPCWMKMAFTMPLVLRFFLLTDVSSHREQLLEYENSIDQWTDEVMDLCRWWQVAASNPHPLKHWCRLSIRTRLIECSSGKGIGGLLAKLNSLPTLLLDYLAFKTELVDANVSIEFDEDEWQLCF